MIDKELEKIAVKILEDIQLVNIRRYKKKRNK